MSEAVAEAERRELRAIEQAQHYRREAERLRAALTQIRDTYLVNHTSKWARDYAGKALADA